MSVLDNPAWHALSGPQQTVAEQHGRALRYDPEFAPFAALPDDVRADDWDSLRTLVGPGGIAPIARADLDRPAGWECVFEILGTQMVWDGGTPDVDPSRPIETLGLADVPEILDLIERTQPGPFAARTVELGPYLGLRDGGALAAMAGCRMHLPGYVEVSAVCTDPAHRGQGLAGALVLRLVADILERGETPCLHAVADNVAAIRLYEQLGFTVRAHFSFVALTPT